MASNCRLSSSSPSAFNFPSIRVFSKESVLYIMWPKYWNYSFSISPSNEYSGLISFRTHSFDLLAVQGTLLSLLRHHNAKASVLQCSAFFMVQLTSIYDYFPRQFSENKKTQTKSPIVIYNSFVQVKTWRQRRCWQWKCNFSYYTFNKYKFVQRSLFKSIQQGFPPSRI